MKVNNQKNQSASALQNSGTHDSKKAGGKAVDKSSRGSALSALSDLGSSGGSSASRVDVSPRARELSRANEIARSGSDIDEARVSHFQDLIDRGMYKPDASKIADKMVDEHVKNIFAAGGDDE